MKLKYEFKLRSIKAMGDLVDHIGALRATEEYGISRPKTTDYFPENEYRNYPLYTVWYDVETSLNNILVPIISDVDRTHTDIKDKWMDVCVYCDNNKDCIEVGEAFYNVLRGKEEYIDSKVVLTMETELLKVLCAPDTLLDRELVWGINSK